jgi:hypothetical protein
MGFVPYSQVQNNFCTVATSVALNLVVRGAGEV